MFNLAIYILGFLIGRLSSANEGVSLSDMRKLYNIPQSTFYRHVNSLIQHRIIARTGRDNYVLHREFVYSVVKLWDGDIEQFSKINNQEYLPDVQMDMFH